MKTPLSLRHKAPASWLVVVGFLISGLASTANANLVVNGDFETGLQSPWTGPFNNTIPSSYLISSPTHNGSYAAGFIGSGGQTVAISQSIPSLIVGQSYVVDFYYKPTGMADLNVTLGGATDTLVVGASSSWLHYMNTMTVTSGTLLTIEQDPSGLNWFYVDDVTVELVVVPEPSTMIAGALLLLPLGAKSLRALRKHRSS